jgi:hypothetical protein
VRGDGNAGAGRVTVGAGFEWVSQSATRARAPMWSGRDQGRGGNGRGGRRRAAGDLEPSGRSPTPALRVVGRGAGGVRVGRRWSRRCVERRPLDVQVRTATSAARERNDRPSIADRHPAAGPARHCSNSQRRVAATGAPAQTRRTSEIRDMRPILSAGRPYLSPARACRKESPRRAPTRLGWSRKASTRREDGRRRPHRRAAGAA